MIKVHGFECGCGETFTDGIDAGEHEAKNPGHVTTHADVSVEPRVWWKEGNTLALFEAVRAKARELDEGFEGEAHERLNSHLVGMARVVGLSEDEVREYFASDRNLTIYEP